MALNTYLKHTRSSNSSFSLRKGGGGFEIAVKTHIAHTATTFLYFTLGNGATRISTEHCMQTING